MSGLRYNQGKLRWRNLPLWILRPVIEVAHFGEGKYETYNFLKGLKVNDTLDSLKRHLDSFEDFEKSDLDDESKCNHMAHVAWNALVILATLKLNPEMDDRYKGENNGK